MPRAPGKRSLALDTETTGLDLHHGARPYLVTTYDQNKDSTWWEWPVDPLTRVVSPSGDDLLEIQDEISQADELILQNAKFDYRALSLLYEDYGLRLEWDWSKVRDTLYAGHLLASNRPHDLTSMVLTYLGIDVQPYEDTMRTAVGEAKAWAKREHPNWRLAKKGLPEMPSAKGDRKSKARGAEESGPWKYDSWLPRLAAEELGLLDDHLWLTATLDYALSDSAVTWELYQVLRRQIVERELWAIYVERLRLLPVVADMESVGVTIHRGRLNELRTRYLSDCEKYLSRCVRLSNGTLTKLPKSGASNELKEILFGQFGLKSSRTTDKGNPSTDKYVLDDWLAELPRNSRPHIFIKNLRAYRRRQNALSYMATYEKFWLPTNDDEGSDWRVLHPSVNPVGTDTLRFSSSNPNSQQFSKQELAEEGQEGRSIRYLLGPTPNREWYSMDAQNIELRIPAYEAGEQSMIDLFERPDDPPYYGSNHLLFFDILHPKMFAEHGAEVKRLYKATWYQWTKNGDFAVQYGAIASSGTADRAYHVPGAQHKIEERLRRIKTHSQRMIDFANRRGYIETVPDRTVDPKRGYPLLCSRSRSGGVLPTVPLSYRTQGTAMWWMCRAMVRCYTYLEQYNLACRPEDRVYIVLQVHDELVFDFPKRGEANLPVVRELQRLMERGGDDIGIPTTVSVEYHSDNWGEGAAVK